MSDDEYDIDFPQLTDKDLEAIDALSQPQPLSPSFPPDHVVALSPPITPSPSRRSPTPQRRMPPGPSLLSLFRSTRPLSVTDLTSPLWCEFQFSYSLLGKRNLPARLRPEKIPLPSGKVITVNKDRENTGDRIMKKGQDVHKVLEREIHPVEVRIEAKTDEEYMGLRLVNMFTGVQSMLESGYTREFPVFGYVHNQHITGIIDEIRRAPLPPPPATAASSDQTSITTFFSPTKAASKPPPSSPAGPLQRQLSSFAPSSSPPPPTHTLSLLDTKTRLSSSLPSPSSTTARSARLQLMLYKLLLDPLLSPTSSARGAFDFPSYFVSTGLDDERPFGDHFIASILNLVEGLGFDGLERARCLRDLAEAWPAALKQLGADKVDNTMQVVYRLQPKRRWGRRSPALRGEEREDTGGSQPQAVGEERGTPPLPEPAEMEVPADVVFMTTPPRAMPGAWPGAVQGPFSAVGERKAQGDPFVEGTTVAGNVVGDLPQGSRTVSTSHDTLPPDPTASSSPTSPSPRPSQPQPAIPPAPADEAQDDGKARILGSQKFQFSQRLVDKHVEEMLALWRGEREAKGVDVEDVNRCWKCPYEDGCEWREMKANEWASSVQAKGHDYY